MAGISKAERERRAAAQLATNPQWNALKDCKPRVDIEARNAGLVRKPGEQDEELLARIADAMAPLEQSGSVVMSIAEVQRLASVGAHVDPSVANMRLPTLHRDGRSDSEMRAHYLTSLCAALPFSGKQVVSGRGEGSMSDEELAEYRAKVANCGEAFAFKPSEVRLFIGNVEIVGFEGFGSVEVK